MKKLLFFLSILLISSCSIEDSSHEPDKNSEESNLIHSIKNNLDVDLIIQKDEEYLCTGNNTSLSYMKISETRAKVFNSKLDEIIIDFDPDNISEMLIEYQDGRIRKGIGYFGLFVKGIDSHGLNPRYETFEECFVREWQDFCDDFVSCVAQATNPIPVAIAIAIHCS